MTNQSSAFAIRGQVLHFLRMPESQDDVSAYEYFEDGLLWIEHGYIKTLQKAAAIENKLPTDLKIHHVPNRLIVPGFVDTHVHYPQMKVIASYGAKLLDWLQTYTFPEEAKFSQIEYSQEIAKLFLDELLKQGTTTALVFCTVHPESVEAFFTQAEKRNLRMIAGKVMMDRNAPEDLTDTAQSSYEQSKSLLKKWHGRSRLSYAVTPRFAPTSSSEQLSLAGKLLQEFPDCYLHTHLSEQVEEIEWVKQLFPRSQDYLDVYDQHGLVTDRSIFAHSIHLSERECERLAQADSAVAFCPSSNLFLGSGLFKLNNMLKHNIKVGLGTDVGGGTSMSIGKTMHDAYTVSAMAGDPMNTLLTYYLATLGGAKALKLDEKIGNFNEGKEADFMVIDMNRNSILSQRIECSDNLHDQLFALMILGDDRNIVQTYVMGEPQF